MNRKEENCIPGTNLLVLDVDSGTTIDTAKYLLSDYKWLLHTTKRHTDAEHRFRMIFPIKFIIKLEADPFKQFMVNFYDWLPFEVDRQTNQRARKWLCSAQHYEYNEGELLDPVNFIPETRKAALISEANAKVSNLPAVERWFATRTSAGNRSNQLIKYAYMLVDSGEAPGTVKDIISSFNKNLQDPLSKSELEATIFKSIDTAAIKRDAA